MGFWYRIGESKLKILSTQFRRCYFQLPHASSSNSTRNPCPLEMPCPNWVFHDVPNRVCSNVRFFAAPVQFQVKQKKEESNGSGPRINDQIKAQYVRLVMDDGHSIVSRLEALECARKLKLDLVEVQKNAKPPVCKIMDFHKEVYKRQEKEKERAKSKSDVTLRKGECKEVRFSEKTDLKDLKMKADMVIKLMEKGYRVKCRASGNENQDFQGALSRLFALIEDVSVVESGPHSVRKEVYMIVRHVKYGPSKKGGGAKKLQVAAHKAQDGYMEPSAVNSNDSIEYENQDFVESGFETDEDNQTNAALKAFSPSESNDLEPPALTKDRYRRATHPSENKFQSTAQVPAAVTKNRYRKADHPSENNVRSTAQMPPAVTENRYKRADHPSENNVRSTSQVPPAVTENRYRRTEPRNRFQQETLNNAGLNNKGPAGFRDTARPIPSNFNQMRQVPVDVNIKPKTEDAKQGVTPGLRNSMPSFADIPKHGLSHPNTPNNNQRPDYGIFSAPRVPETPGVKPGMHRNGEGNSQDLARQPFSTESR